VGEIEINFDILFTEQQIQTLGVRYM